MGRMNKADKIITKSSGTCYAVRLVAQNSNTNTLKFILHCTVQNGKEYLSEVDRQTVERYLP
jgi:hypothetical protein